MKVSTLSALILICLALLASSSNIVQASLPSPTSNSFLANAASTAVSNLWDASKGAFKASPFTEPYNYWIDDQGKMLDLLAASPTYYSYGSQATDFIASHMTTDGSVIRRTIIQYPTITSANPLNFAMDNRMVETYGDLSKAKDRSFRILYLPQGTMMAYIQGHVVWDGVADRDLSYVYPPTGYSMSSGTSGGLAYARATQIWDLANFTMTIDYTLWEHRPYLDVGYTFYAKINMTDVKVVVPLDQLDWLGSTIYPGGPSLGYQWIWIPGYPDQKSNDTQNQHFLPNPSQWNATWYMVHMHDKPDGVSNSLAIVADWGANKTALGAIDNALTGSPLPWNRLSPNLHWLKQYAFLHDMIVGQTKKFSLKYYFLNAHDWTNLWPTYHEIFDLWPSLADLDPSQNYQYGAIVYGLARMYQATGTSKYINQALKIWSNWDRMFQSAGTWPHVNGTYMQSLPFMLRAELLLFSLTSDPGLQAQLNAAINRALNKLLEAQQLDIAKPNYGGFQEWRFYNFTSGIQYWGNSYEDFTAPAMTALSAYYDARGNSTVLERISKATGPWTVADGTPSYKYVMWDPVTQSESYATVPAGHIVHAQNTTEGVYDWSWPAYKSAMIAQAYASILDDLGYNKPIAMRAITQLWWKSTLNGTHTVVYVDSGKYETNSETQPWGAVAWHAWMQSASTLTGSASMTIMSILSSGKANMTNLAWSAGSQYGTYSITMQLPSGESLKARVSAAKEIAGVYMSGASSLSYTWQASNSLAEILFSVPSSGSYVLQVRYPIIFDIHTDYPYSCISWTGSGGTKNFTGYMSANERIGIVNASQTGYYLGFVYPEWWILVNDTSSGSNQVCMVYNKKLGWVFSNSPMPNSIYGEQSLMGNFTLNGPLHVKVDSGVFAYGPRMAQLEGLTAPYGNGTWSAYRYDLLVVPIPGYVYGQIYVTWEQAGPGTATLVVVGIIAVSAAGVIYVARKKIKK